jgi:3-oxoacyl-[acyl-carrier-protein] synthase-3
MTKIFGTAAHEVLLLIVACMWVRCSQGWTQHNLSAGSRPPLSSSSKSALSMAQSGTLPCRPIGVGHAAPATIITNKDMESVVETSDEWIQARTGIAQRRVLQNGETLRSLGVEASRNALEMAKLSATDIDVVICATSSPDDMFGDATAIAAELGCGTNTVAFDLTAACSGFLFGSVTAGQFLSSPGTKLKNALVIGQDALSRFVDWDDRNSCILFGDGAGAMVVTNSPHADNTPAAGLLGYSAHSNGHGYPDLNCL